MKGSRWLFSLVTQRVVALTMALMLFFCKFEGFNVFGSSFHRYFRHSDCEIYCFLIDGEASWRKSVSDVYVR